MSQQFQVPQFIEHEARLIGPLTVRQTAVLAGIGAILFVLWFVLERWLFFVVSVPISFAALALGFLKVNGRPLVSFIFSFLSFFISPQIFIWQKRAETVKKNSRKKKGAEVFEGTSAEVTKKEIGELARRLDK